MSSISVVQRLRCSICLRPQSTCICRWITPIRNAAELLILQHPLEAGHAKGSAQLLHLSLQGSRLVTGESFDEQALRRLLHGPLLDAPASPAATVLLYPDTPDTGAAGIAPPPVLDEAVLREPHGLRLVVLDGTWRKSRKMLHANPLLQQLPRLPLRDVPASQYLIRKAHGAHQLSTLEASCYALMRLEGNEGRYRPLLDAFSGFVEQQRALINRRAESPSRE